MPRLEGGKIVATFLEWTGEDWQAGGLEVLGKKAQSRSPALSKLRVFWISLADTLEEPWEEVADGDTLLFHGVAVADGDGIF